MNETPEKVVDGPSELGAVLSRHARRAQARATRAKMPAAFRNEVSSRQVAAYLATKDKKAPRLKVSQA